MDISTLIYIICEEFIQLDHILENNDFSSY